MVDFGLLHLLVAVAAKSIAVLLVLGAAAADVIRHNDRSFAGVNPNTLSCDPQGRKELLLPHHTDCTKFYQCVHGREVERLCARPLIFHFEIQSCNWAHETPCVLRNPDGGGEDQERDESDKSDNGDKSDESEGEGEGNGGDQGGDNGSDKPMAGVDPNTLSCDPKGQIFLLLPHHEDCTKYYQCSNGREILMPGCPHPLIFDFELQGCNWEWDATCILRTPQEEEKSEEEKKSSEEEDKNSGGDGENESENDNSSNTEDNTSESGQQESEQQESEEIEEDSGHVDSDEEGSGDSDEHGIGDGGSGDSGDNEGVESIEGSGNGDGSGDFEWLAFEMAEPQPNDDPLDILARLTGRVVQGAKPVTLDDVKDTSEFSAILDCSRADAASRHVAHKTDCQRFWRCVGGVPETFYCSDGLFFNERSQQCDFESNVRCLAGQVDELDGEFIVYS